MLRHRNLTRTCTANASALALAFLASGCAAATSSPPTAPVTETAAPAGPSAQPASTANVQAEPPTCELGVWDEAAKACAIPPRGATGDPGGWAGCSQAKGPQNSRCFTGTHWESCACVCDGATTWNDAKRRCE